ncbi:MAG: 3-oxoacid CoA-transferase [Synergistaceae bacterium]|nr:3-oxoacid CoA-transferase [Synergistaceae bacterium]
MMQVITASQAASLIQDNFVTGIGGSGGCSTPEYILTAIAERYKADNSPRNITVVAGIAPGDLREDGLGFSIIRAPGLVGGIYAGHIGMSPAIGRGVAENKIAGVCVPLGVYSQILKAIAAQNPGVVSHVGLNTFADPRLEGCFMNELARKFFKFKPVELININNQEFLFYNAFTLDACIIRGSFADEAGNISLEREPFLSEQQSMAAAVHNSGGIVIVQVLDILKRGAIHPRKIHVQAHLVDYVVKVPAELHNKFHVQCYGNLNHEYRPELTGDIKINLSELKPMSLTPRKVCGRRGAMELKAGALINLGIGMPDSVASVANEEGVADKLTLSLETGLFGGVPLQGVGFGAAANPEAVYQVADNFDLYDGGVLDMAVLGAAEIDEQGNVNVSKFGTRCMGPGGFIDITQNTHKICFMGTFTANGLECEIGGGKIKILSEGRDRKFKKRVEQITFAGQNALLNGQNIIYITERAVFKLCDNGIELIEIAPGIDLQRDILANMDFKPEISQDLKLMDARIFMADKMNLKI